MKLSREKNILSLNPKEENKYSPRISRWRNLYKNPLAMKTLRKMIKSSFQIQKKGDFRGRKDQPQ